MLDRCIPALRQAASVLGLAALLALLPILTAAAQDADIFTVRDVKVDVSADSAAAARDQAIAKAQRDAFAKLLARLTPREDNRQPLPGMTLEPLVDSFEVQEERASAVRYMGTMTVSFRPNVVRQFLISQGWRYAEVRSKPVLVVPVAIENGQPVLWERETEWRQAWSEAASADGLLPVLVPVGDATDLATVDAAAAVGGQSDGLLRLAERYGAGQLVVAEVGQGNGVTLTRHAQGKPPAAETLNVAVASPDQYPAAAAAAIQRMEEDWKRPNLVASGTENRFVALVPIRGLEDWADTRKRLAQIPTVTRTKVISLNRSEALLEVAHVGEVGALRGALAQRDLALGRVPADRAPPAVGEAPAWVLSRQGGQ
ncbi:MAG TPA: DUF2066 domain-containing protein [Azospirillaceae bacterium]|nr:DUF2066 domain-containing protein [Azospirillaceae bacterium]